MVVCIVVPSVVTAMVHTGIDTNRPSPKGGRNLGGRGRLAIGNWTSSQSTIVEDSISLLSHHNENSIPSSAAALCFASLQLI